MNITFTGLSPSMVSFSKLFKFFHQNYWPIPFSLATTNGISIDFFSSGYLDVSVLQVISLNLFIQFKVPHKVVGFPIRKFSDQNLHTVPRNLSQYTTSFFGFQCQGIRHTPLNAWFMHRKKFCVESNFVGMFIYSNIHWLFIYSNNRI